MKSFYNKLNVTIAISFVLGMLFTAFNLYNLPAELKKISSKIDLLVIKELSPVLNQTYLIVGVTLILGLGAIFLALYLLNINKTSEKIVYIEKTESQKQEEDKEEEKVKNEDFNKRVKEVRGDIKKAKDKKSRYEKVLSNLCMKLEASQGIMYEVSKEKNKRFLKLLATFAYNLPDSGTITYEFGEGLAGQVAKEGKKININDVPKGYITIVSGLGASSPNHLAILPIKQGNEVVAVVEIASFKEISSDDEKLIGAALKLEEEYQDLERKALENTEKSKLSKNKKKLDV